MVGVALLAALVVLSSARATWLVLGAVALALGVLWPVTLCYLLIPAIAFGSLVSLGVGPLRAGPTDLLVAALAAGWVWRGRQRAERLRDAPSAEPQRTTAALRTFLRRQRLPVAVTAAMGAYLLVILLSALVAADRSAAAKEALKWGEALVVFALAVATLRTPRQRWTAAGLMVAAGLAEALIGYGQWVAAAGLLGQSGGGVRVFGTFAQPNPYAAYLNLALPFALALAIFGRDARARWVAGGAAALMVGAQLLVASRGGLLALGAAALVVVAVGWGMERAALALGAAVAGVGALTLAAGISPAGLQRRALERLGVASVSLHGPINDANFSAVERLAHWAAGIRMFRAHPLLGVGAGNYDAAYSRFAVVSWSAPLGHAHNYYINVAAETGILGLAAFLSVLGALLHIAWRTARLPPASSRMDASQRRALPGDRRERAALRWLLPCSVDGRVDAPALAASCREARALVLGVLGVVVALAVHSLVDDPFVHAMELQVALCAALVVAGLNVTGPEDARAGGIPG
jgi:O-antigen ligase